MAINSRSLSAVQGDVTATATTEGDFRDGMNDTLTQVSANEVKLDRVTDADLDKLNDVTATAAELNILDTVTATATEINYLAGASSGVVDLGSAQTITGIKTVGTFRFADGSAGTPSISNNGDTNTGIFFSEADAVNISTGGTERFEIDGTSCNITVPVLLPNGSATAPTHGFSGDADTGAYLVSTGTYGVTTAGTKRLQINSSSALFDVKIEAPAGTAALPSITNTSNSDTGIWFSAADHLNISTGGTERLEIDNTTATWTIPVEFTAGTAGSPSLIASGDTDTGIFFSAADTLNISTGGTERFEIDSTQATFTVPVDTTVLTVEDGSATSPSIRNDGDPNTGIFFSAADTVNISTGGTERFEIDSTQATFTVPVDTTVLTVEDGSATAPSIRNDGDTNTGIYFSAADTVNISTGGTQAANWDSNQVLNLQAAVTEDVNALTISSGASSVDVRDGGIFTITLSANTTLTFSNPAASGSGSSFTLVVTQDSTGSRTITWPSSVDWAGGTAPTLSTGASDVDILTFFTTNGGTTWYGFPAGLNMS